MPLKNEILVSEPLRDWHMLISNKVHFGMLMSIFTLEIQFYQIFHHRGTHNISPFS